MAKKKRNTTSSEHAGNRPPRSNPARVPVCKTYKLFIGGKFPRTESGRYYLAKNKDRPVANVCRASRKDFRNAVVAAKAAHSGWAGRSAYNRSQILYRIAEMMESRRDALIAELVFQGTTSRQAQREVDLAIDRTIHYAGWCDKYQQILACVNPVASAHFNFSVLEPMGVVALFAPQKAPLLGLLSLVLPTIVGGNTVVAVASESHPLSAITWAEVLATSDVPAGVVNILTGYRQELTPHAARHMDVNAIGIADPNGDERKLVETHAAENVKRVRCYDRDWYQSDAQSPYLIQDFCEVKTTWHPIEVIGPSGSGY